MAVCAALLLSACAGRTTGATNITDFSATLHANARCDKGEVCTWYWEYWPADQPRIGGRDQPGSAKTPVQGPVTGPTGNRELSTTISGLFPDRSYRWVFCASPDNGAVYGCSGPQGSFGSTTSDPPPDFATFTTLPQRTLAEGWNGTSWTIQPAPNRSGPNRALGGLLHLGHGMHCRWRSRRAAGRTLEWDDLDDPVHSRQRSNAASLSGVSCTSATACTAVGVSPGRHAPLAEAWDGTTWTIQPTPNPNPTGADSFLQGVSCTSATACEAVGVSIGYASANPPAQNTELAEGWDGTTWTIQPIVNPDGGLAGVSCTSATACIAVGSGQTLADRWDGTTWTPLTTPSPGQYANLSGVSCTSATACTAVGGYYNGTNNVTLAERWDGTSWTVQPTPSPGANDNLTSVSCTSATACTAVGHENNAGIQVTLAERWDGTSWTIQPTPSLSPNPYNTLLGVSCTSATACVAVGQH